MVFYAAVSLMLTAPPVPAYVAIQEEVLVEAVQQHTKRNVEHVVKASVKAGQEYNISPVWLLAVFGVESGYKPKAIGDAGKAYGLGQIHYPYIRGKTSPCRSIRNNRTHICKRKDLLEPYLNARVAAWIFNKYRKRWPGHEAVIYNCGIRCCIKKKRGRCVKHAAFTRTTLKYNKRHRALWRYINGRETSAKRDRLQGISVL